MEHSVQWDLQSLGLRHTKFWVPKLTLQQNPISAQQTNQTTPPLAHLTSGFTGSANKDRETEGVGEGWNGGATWLLSRPPLIANLFTREMENQVLGRHTRQQGENYYLENTILHWPNLSTKCIRSALITRHFTS